MDTQEVKENLSLTEQLLYRIAGLSAELQQGFRRIDEKMDRFQTDLHETTFATNDRINTLDKEISEVILRKRQRMDELEKRLTEAERNFERRYQERGAYTDEKFSHVETWQAVAKAQIMLVVTAVVAAWSLFGPAVRNVLGLPG